MAKDSDRSLLEAQSLRERKKLESARNIVEAARGIVRDGGVEALTVERIADRAGVSPPTVFNLVGKREHIWAAIVDRSIEDLELEGLVDPADGAGSARAVVSAMVDMVCGDPGVFQPLLRYWGQAVEAMRSNPGRLLRESFATAGATRPEHSSRLAVAGFIGMLNLWSLGLVDDRELRESCVELVDLALTSVAPKR